MPFFRSNTMSSISLGALGGVLALALSLDGLAATFVAAHPDDMELFMSSNLLHDLQVTKAPTVLILMTGGDAGVRDAYGPPNAKGDSYAKVRLAAHEAAIRYALSSQGRGDVPDTIPSQELIANKLLSVKTIGNVKLYDLMLPDGDANGAGYASGRNQSMARLYSGAISRIDSYDSQKNSYSLQQLQATIAGIVTNNIKAGVSKWVNLPDPQGSGHSDHAHSALIALDALKAYGCLHFALFTDYSNSGRPVNSTSDSRFVEQVALFAFLNKALVDGGNETTFDARHVAWLGRTYWREMRGSGNCTF